MDMSTHIPMAGYFIYRAGEPSDPTALEFCPPKGSDELFFALKVAFPHVKTHSDRMRNAVIEFLKQELTQEQNQMVAPAIPMESSLSYEALSESPWSSWPSMASTSTLSSPDLLNLATPASMSPHAPTMSRQNSSVQSNTAPKSKPGLEDMTGVFSLSSSSQPKTRVRRKMTETEKVEYRKRRIVKACDSCSKRKRKCTHNQPEMEKVRSSKITKNRVPTSNINPSARVGQIDKTFFQPAEPSGFAEDPFMFLDQNMFNELPATDPLLFNDEEMDNLFAPKMAQSTQELPSTVWPWSDTPDWTLIDTPLLAHVSPSSPSYTQTLFPQSTGLLSPQATPQVELIHEPADQSKTSEVPRTERQTPTRTWRTFSDFSRTAFSTADGLDGKEMPLVKSASMGLSTPGGMVLPTQPHTRPSTVATLTGPQTSFSRSTDKQSVQPANDSQSSRSPDSSAHTLIQGSRPSLLRPNASDGGSGRTVIGSLTSVSSQVTYGQIIGGLHHVQSDAGLSPRLDMAEESHSKANSSNNYVASRAPSNTSQGELLVKPQGVGTANTDLADGLFNGRQTAGLSPLAAIASSQQFTSSAGLGNQGLDNSPQEQSTPRNAARRSAEVPSAARPSSLSADSTSTSSSSSTSRTAPPDGRNSTANFSVLEHRRSTDSAKAVLLPFHKIAHDEDPGKQVQALQSKLCSAAVVETSSERNDRGEKPALGLLKSGVPVTNGRKIILADYLSSMDAAFAAPTTSTPQEPERTKRPHDQPRPTTESGESQQHGQLSIAKEHPGSTQLAAAVFTARLCVAWRTVAATLMQTLSARTTSCRASRVALDTPRAVGMV